MALDEADAQLGLVSVLSPVQRDEEKREQTNVPAFMCNYRNEKLAVPHFPHPV